MTSSPPLELAALLLLMIPYLGLGHPRLLEAARAISSRWPGALALTMALVAPAVVALPWSRPGESVARAGWLALYAAAPLAALLAARSLPREISAWDGAAVVLYWAPLQVWGLERWWLAAGNSVPAPWMKITTACLVLGGFAGVRRLEGVGYRWRVTGTDVVTALSATAAFLAVAVPAALLSDLYVWEPVSIPADRLLTTILAIALFTALPEEIMFRGVLFNLLQRGLRGRGGPWPALVITSAAFAAAHIGPGGGGGALFLLLVALAGAAYGWCYLRTGSLMPAVAAHTAVNAVQQLLFATAPGSA